VAATAGTTNSGAIDPLAELHPLCDHYGLWLHVDGAYGAPAILSGQYRQALMPIALDPHKWLYVPVGAGLVLIRDGQAMRDTFSLVPPYLRNDGATSDIFGLPWFSEYGVQQSRSFRALKVWMSLKHHGLSGYAEAIERDIALAEYLAQLVDRSDHLQRLASGLSIVCFRYVPPLWHGDAVRLDDLNKALLETLQRSGEAFLSSTTLDGTFVLRACIINPRTGPEDLKRLVALVQDFGAQLARGKREPLVSTPWASYQRRAIPILLQHCSGSGTPPASRLGKVHDVPRRSLITAACGLDGLDGDSTRYSFRLAA
jgi:aromatic-L-amino-acid decarboxylase